MTAYKMVGRHKNKTTRFEGFTSFRRPSTGLDVAHYLLKLVLLKFIEAADVQATLPIRTVLSLSWNVDLGL